MIRKVEKKSWLFEDTIDAVTTVCTLFLFAIFASFFLGVSKFAHCYHWVFYSTLHTVVIFKSLKTYVFVHSLVLPSRHFWRSFAVDRTCRFESQLFGRRSYNARSSKENFESFRIFDSKLPFSLDLFLVVHFCFNNSIKFFRVSVALIIQNQLKFWKSFIPLTKLLGPTTVISV